MARMWQKRARQNLDELRDLEGEKGKIWAEVKKVFGNSIGMLEQIKIWDLGQRNGDYNNY